MVLEVQADKFWQNVEDRLADKKTTVRKMEKEIGVRYYYCHDLKATNRIPPQKTIEAINNFIAGFRQNSGPSKTGTIFWSNVKQELDDKKISQVSFSKEIQIDETTLSNSLKHGILPRGAIIDGICETLDLDPWVLFLEDNDE